MTARALDGAHAVVLGGAGFLGSHLCDRLLVDGARVTAVDNLITGRRENLAHLDGNNRFAFVGADIVGGIPVDGAADFVLNMASPASPPHYLRWPVETLRVGSLGTERGLQLAGEHGARFLQASTSEVYGDPEVNPQPESYWGNVNPIGPRSVYDEAKRYGEALSMAYAREHGVDVGIIRIFNTYGPRMRVDDGRAVPAFFEAALAGRPLPVHGDGSQTRSLCYVDDLVDGIVCMLLSTERGPVNLGNPEEVTILELAEAIQDVVGNHPGVDFHPRPTDDPTVRRPDIARAREALGWEPAVPLRDGLARTLGWFRDGRGVSEQPVVLFLHIPKTGGTTLNSVIYAAMARSDGTEADPDGIGRFLRDGVYYHPIGFYKDPAGWIPRYVTVFMARPDLRAAVGHFSFGIHRATHAATTYVAMVRHPVDRVWSLYSHLHQTGVISAEATLQDLLDGSSPEIWAADLVSWHPLRPPHDEGRMRALSFAITDNDQCRRLAGMEPPLGGVTGDVLRAAQRNAGECFAVVGTTDRFDASLLLMKRRLRWAEAPTYLPRLVNRRRPPSPTLSEVAMIEDRNRWDLELYEWVAARLDAEIASEGAEFERQFDAYVDVNQAHQAEHLAAISSMGLE